MKERTNTVGSEPTKSADASAQYPDQEIPENSLMSDDDSGSFISPPPYGETQGQIDLTQDGFHTDARLDNDGRIDINIDAKSRRLSMLLAPALRSQIEVQENTLPPFSPVSGLAQGFPLPGLNVVIQLVGSRGDIQPFVALGLELKAFGHRVRIATHPTFQSLVEQSGLEFFSIGGDPAELMTFMVKNPGLLPGFDAVVKGEVRKRRKSLHAMLHGCWRSCIEAGDGIDMSPLTREAKPRRDPKPFVADAIISNPPAFAHVHCAEKLGVPLHMVFTMPWTPTQAFAHPLANIKSSNADSSITNYLSFVLVEMIIWQGVGGVVNRFRRKTLGLDPIDSTAGPSVVTRLKIPHTYCWSPSLIAKPRDWGMHISVSGFSFLPLGSSYMPPQELASFIEDGDPPIYVGFGSIVVDDPGTLTALILEAIHIAGVRAILAKGWADLGDGTLPSNVYSVANCPHDWLFKHVACVVHHGGAGTTSAGIAAGKPTVVVPFFGDQPFWGNMVFRAGAGPEPLPFKKLTAAHLAAAITAAMDPKMMVAAQSLGAKLSDESGSTTAAKSFQDRLPLALMGCSMVPRRTAVWQLRKSKVKLSALAATVLRKEDLVSFKQLELYRPCEYEVNTAPWEPISGGLLAVTRLFYDVIKGVGDIGSDFGRVHSNMENLGRAMTRPQSSLMYPPSESSSRTPPQWGSSDSNIVGTGLVKGTARMIKSAVRAPMTFTMGLTQGAHNLPKVWGDTTVRPEEKITGVGSGFVAAAKELTLGTYDGISGIIVQPILGAREEGVLGFVKGVGKGIAGTPVKFLAAASGTVGYSLKGLDVEITRVLRGLKLDAIFSARMAQGEWEYREATEEERMEIVERWHKEEASRLEKERSEGKGKGKGKGKVKLERMDSEHSM